MTYEATRQRHVADARALTPRFVERLAWPADRLAEHRTQRLRALVGAATQRSRWHRDRLAGVDVNALSEGTLRALPVMTRTDLMEHFDGVVTDDRLTLAAANDRLERTGRGEPGYLFERYSVITSGGSSGLRGVFVYDWDAWAIFYVSVRRHLARYLTPPTPTTAPPVAVTIGSANPIHAMAAGSRTFDGAHFRVRHFPVSMPMEEIVSGLNQVQPLLLSGYASALRLLAAEAEAGRLRISPERVTSGSEPLLPEIRAALEAAWGVPVGNLWAASEGGGLGVPCDAGRTHLSDDLFIIEPVDAQGAPVAPGACAAKLYLTNLYNHAQPLIRYEVTDQVMIGPEPCSCGSAHRCIADIQGRLEDVFLYDGVAVHPEVFDARVGRERHIVEFQVQQTPRGAALLIRCDGAVDIDGLERGLGDDLRRLGIASAEVSVREVERIPRNPSGKIARYVPIASADKRTAA